MLAKIMFFFFFNLLQQLLVLETNLLLGGLGLHDQHRDMRLDIDNMSYEVCSIKHCCVIGCHDYFQNSYCFSIYFFSFLSFLLFFHLCFDICNTNFL